MALDHLEVSEVYRAQYEFVWRILRHLGVPREAVDDALQDVFVVVARRIASFDRGAPVRAWLFGIARRVARDHRRASKRHRKRLAVLASASIGDPSAAEIEQAEAADTVRRLLGSLTEEQRVALILADLEGWTAPEIAEAVDAKVNTVYSRLRLARKRLEQVVSEEGESKCPS